jgi:hypothetical protein
MRKTIRLTENDLTRLVKKVIMESELEIQPGDLTPEVNISTSELDQEGTLPPIVVKALNSPVGKALTTQIDEFCSKGQPKESILSFLRGKLREFRQKKKGKKNQVQEQGSFILQGVGMIVGMILLVIILLRIFNGPSGDGCARYSRRFRRNFSIN